VVRIVVEGKEAFNQNQCFLRQLLFVFSDGSSQTVDACSDDYTADPFDSLLTYELVPVVTSWVRVNLILNEVNGTDWQSYRTVTMKSIDFYGASGTSTIAPTRAPTGAPSSAPNASPSTGNHCNHLPMPPTALPHSAWSHSIHPSIGPLIFVDGDYF
jgi:hypothetical protein